MVGYLFRQNGLRFLPEKDIIRLGGQVDKMESRSCPLCLFKIEYFRPYLAVELRYGLDNRGTMACYGMK